MEKVIMLKLNKEYKKKYALNNLKDFYEKVFEKEKINKKEYYDLYYYNCKENKWAILSSIDEESFITFKQQEKLQIKLMPNLRKMLLPIPKGILDLFKVDYVITCTLSKEKISYKNNIIRLNKIEEPILECINIQMKNKKEKQIIKLYPKLLDKEIELYVVEPRRFYRIKDRILNNPLSQKLVLSYLDILSLTIKVVITIEE